MSVIRDNICLQLQSTLNGLVTTVGGAYLFLSNYINTIKTAIAGLQYSAIDALNHAASQIDSALDDLIPDFNSEAFDEMLAIINACAFLRTDKTLGNPLPLLRNLGSAVRQTAQDGVNEIIEGLEEFNVAKLFDSLFIKYADDFDFGTIIPNIYKIIDCIQSICTNVDIASTILEFESYSKKLFLLTNGTFDRITFFDQIGLSAQKAAKINISIDSYKSITDRTKKQINQGITFFKSLI